ncbi:MAG: hypothetical protein AAB339_01055, partial [Elusimicrobiota bacterium]
MSRLRRILPWVLAVPPILLGSSCRKGEAPAPPARQDPAPPKVEMPLALSVPSPDPFAKIPTFENFKPSIPKGFEKLSPDALAYWIKGGYEILFIKIQMEEDRKELVRPAPPGFKPEAVDRKVKLTLIPRETSIRTGEEFWYALELQNLGREPMDYWEVPGSFMKDGLR